MPAPRPVRIPETRRLALPPRAIAGEVARQRSREAQVERGVLGAFLLLALTASGFAAYAISGGSRPYAVQALLPARIQTFMWKRSPAQDVASAPAVDLDPTTTGALPDRWPAAPPMMDLPEPTTGGSYTLRRIAGGVAVLAGAGGAEREVTTGSELPGAGRVLAIRKTGAGWVVITTETIIGPAQL